MHKIEYLPIAEEDIISTVNYISFALDAPKAARDLLEELNKTVLQISEFPYSCELYKTSRPLKEEIRKVPVKGYVLYYAVFQDRIEIRRFMHGRRDRSNIN